jgi:hypothetical protein
LHSQQFSAARSWPPAGALYGLNAGIIDRTQFSLLITVVVLSAIVPTAIAQRFYQPHPELGRARRQPVEEFWPESEVA